jgi:hypothetical protein
VIPTPDDVAAVARMTDLPARNRAVTLGYFQFSQRLRHWFGDQVSWPTFAAWASAQAGHTIRKEDLLRALEQRLGDSSAVRRIVDGPVKRAAGFILREVLDLNPFERSSQAVSRGNIKVYAEIGGVFARFLAMLDANPGESDLQALLGSLLPGPPPGGQDHLRQAFPSYWKAMRTPPGKARSELVLMGNLWIGLHEQTRLQPEIEGAVDGSFWDFVEVKERVLSRVAPHLHLAGQAGKAAIRRRLEPVVDAILREAQTIVREIITSRLMVIELPGEIIRLGDDLSGGYPPDLRTLENPDLIDALARVDPTPDSTRGSGARNWADFNERMHFIAELFRSRQASDRLFVQPA